MSWTSARTWAGTRSCRRSGTATASAPPRAGRRLDPAQLGERIRRGLRLHGLAELIRVDVEVADRVDPDPNSGKLKRITTRVGPPEPPWPQSPDMATSDTSSSRGIATDGVKQMALARALEVLRGADLLQ